MHTYTNSRSHIYVYTCSVHACMYICMYTPIHVDSKLICKYTHIHVDTDPCVHANTVQLSLALMWWKYWIITLLVHIKIPACLFSLKLFKDSPLELVLMRCFVVWGLMQKSSFKMWRCCFWCPSGGSEVSPGVKCDPKLSLYRDTKLLTIALRIKQTFSVLLHVI